LKKRLKRPRKNKREKSPTERRKRSEQDERNVVENPWRLRKWWIRKPRPM
jgi:hypothetical protein